MNKYKKKLKNLGMEKGFSFILPLFSSFIR